MAITQFRGPNRFLSNFWAAKVELDGVVYPSVEHAYQAAKTLDNGPNGRLWIRSMDTAGKAKRAGKRLTLRPDWDSVKLVLMKDLLRQKFSNNALAALLLATGSEELIEGNDWGDRYWGAEWRFGEWVGENHLGKLLMKVREELK